MTELIIVLAACIAIFIFLFVFQLIETIQLYKKIKKQRMCTIHKWDTSKGYLVCTKCKLLGGTDEYEVNND